MTIYIQDTQPRMQSFLPFKDSSSSTINGTSSCGLKKYSISDPLTLITPPSSNSLDLDLWTISAYTTDVNFIGVRTVTVSASFISYPALPTVNISFKPTVIDGCSIAKVSHRNQKIGTMNYVPVKASGPTLQTFQSFDHDFALQNVNPRICGPIKYTIVQGYSFVQIIRPIGDPYVDEWTLSVETSNMNEIGSHEVTLQASLTNFPSSVQAVLSFVVQIFNPCNQTILKPKAIQPMAYKLGQAIATTQSFAQIQDDVSLLISQANFCGERTQKLIGEFPFLNFTIPTDPWTQNLQFDLQTNDYRQIGNYTATLEVDLVSFPLKVPLKIRMPIYIFPMPQNKLPHFDPQLESVLSILKTENLNPWSFSLPKIVDQDPNDIVKMTVDFGSANFLTLSRDNMIECSDISMNSNVKAGMYLIKITLDDGRDKVNFQVSQFVYDFKKESTNDESTAANHNNETSISENQSMNNETESSSTEQVLSPYTYVPPVPKKVLQRALIVPRASVESISDTGLTRIKFSKPMIIPNFLEDIPRRVKEATFIDYTDKVISVEVLPGILEDFEKLKIGNFTIKEFTELEILIQVNFQSPAFISMSAIQPDELMITFLSRTYFVDAIDFLQVEQKQLKRILTPQQSQAQAESIKKLESAVSKSMTAVTSGNIILNIVLSYGLKYLWNMVNLLQFLVFIEQWKFSLPQNAGAFLKYLKNLALMEFVDTTPATNWISDKLGLCIPCKEERKTKKMLSQLMATNSTNTTRRRELNETDTKSEQEEQKNGEDTNIVLNLGIVVILFLCILGALFALFMMKYVVYYKYSWFKFYANLKRKIFYNTFIRSFLQGALKMQIAFCVTLMADGGTNWSGARIIIQKVVAVTGLAVLSLIPVIFFLVLRYKRSELWRPSVKAQIGSLYLGINLRSAWALSYSIVFMLRRTLFVFLMFSLMKQPAIQMNLFIYSSIFYIIYLQYVRPHDDASSVLIETCNEVILLVICYHFILLTDLISDPFVKFKIGLSLIVCVCLMIALNLSIIVFVSLRQLCYDLRKKRALRLQAQRDFLKKTIPAVTENQLEQLAVIQEQSKEDDSEEEQQIEEEKIPEVVQRNRSAWSEHQKSSPDQSFHSDCIYIPLGMNQIDEENQLEVRSILRQQDKTNGIQNIPIGQTAQEYDGFFTFYHPQLKLIPRSDSTGHMRIIEDQPIDFLQPQLHNPIDMNTKKRNKLTITRKLASKKQKDE